MGNSIYRGRYVYYRGANLSYFEAADLAGVTADSICRRIRQGWTHDEVCETPRGKRPARITEAEINTAKETKAAADNLSIQLFGRRIGWLEALTMKWRTS